MKPNYVGEVIIRRLAPCPCCRKFCPRHSMGRRKVRDINGQFLVIAYSKHYCAVCGKHFSLRPDSAAKGSRYSIGLRREALKFIAAGETLLAVAKRLRIPQSTIYGWTEGLASVRAG